VSALAEVPAAAEKCRGDDVIGRRYALPRTRWSRDAADWLRTTQRTPWRTKRTRRKTQRTARTTEATTQMPEKGDVTDDEPDDDTRVGAD